MYGEYLSALRSFYDISTLIGYLMLSFFITIEYIDNNDQDYT